MLLCIKTNQNFLSKLIIRWVINLYVFTNYPFVTDTNKRLGTPGSGNEWGGAQTSTQMSRDKWGWANKREWAGDKCEWAATSGNMRRGPQTCRDEREQVGTSTNEGWEGEWAWMWGLGGLVSTNGEAAAATTTAAPAPLFFHLVSTSCCCCSSSEYIYYYNK
jgi:hypothetical protein